MHILGYQLGCFYVLQSSNAFAGKHGFITPRDLFKWADRAAVGYHQLAENGYLILAERLRNPIEQSVVKDVLEKTLKVEVRSRSLLKLVSLSLCEFFSYH